MTTHDGVTTQLDQDQVSATTAVAARPNEVFEFLRRPANHARISGDHTVQGTRFGPELLGPADRFGMAMKMFGLPYRMTSVVKEYEEDRKIGWSHIGGHMWRWEVEPTDEGTRVTETFDLSTAVAPWALRLVGFPKRHLDNVAQSVANVRAHFA